MFGRVSRFEKYQQFERINQWHFTLRVLFEFMIARGHVWEIKIFSCKFLLTLFRLTCFVKILPKMGYICVNIYAVVISILEVYPFDLLSILQYRSALDSDEIDENLRLLRNSVVLITVRTRRWTTDPIIKAFLALLRIHKMPILA